VSASTTTIRGVSIYSRQPKRKADVFDIALSPEGIAILRPGRNEQHMTWDRISQWEIEERPDCLVLTLRGGGSVTPLLVQGWSRQDLETVIEETATSSGGRGAAEGAPVAASVVPRAVRRRAARRPRRGAWKALVTIVLLVALATAVTLVLLQSAGAISWSFLGPVA
jgi:hypothetical protein